MISLLRKFSRSKDGATAIEYGLILALISILIIVSAIAIGGSLKGKWEFVATETAK